MRLWRRDGRPIQLRKPLPAGSLERRDPKQLIVTPQTVIKKAEFPVVDVHTHVLLSYKNPGEYLKILDEAGVAVLVDSPLATFGQRTEDAYQQMEKLYPNRYITFGTINFADRYQEGFAEEAVASLEADVKTMRIAGVTKTYLVNEKK